MRKVLALATVLLFVLGMASGAGAFGSFYSSGSTSGSYVGSRGNVNWGSYTNNPDNTMTAGGGYRGLQSGSAYRAFKTTSGLVVVGGSVQQWSSGNKSSVRVTGFSFATSTAPIPD